MPEGEDLDAALRLVVIEALLRSPLRTSEIAWRLGVSDPYVSMLRNGSKALSVSQARRVLRGMGYDVEVKVSARLVEREAHGEPGSS